MRNQIRTFVVFVVALLCGVALADNWMTFTTKGVVSLAPGETILVGTGSPVFDGKWHGFVPAATSTLVDGLNKSNRWMKIWRTKEKVDIDTSPLIATLDGLVKVKWVSGIAGKNLIPIRFKFNGQTTDTLPEKFRLEPIGTVGVAKVLGNRPGYKPPEKRYWVSPGDLRRRENGVSGFLTGAPIYPECFCTRFGQPVALKAILGTDQQYVLEPNFAGVTFGWAVTPDKELEGVEITVFDRVIDTDPDGNKWESMGSALPFRLQRWAFLAKGNPPVGTVAWGSQRYFHLEAGGMKIEAPCEDEGSQGILVCDSYFVDERGPAIQLTVREDKRTGEVSITNNIRETPMIDNMVPWTWTVEESPSNFPAYTGSR